MNGIHTTDYAQENLQTMMYQVDSPALPFAAESVEVAIYLQRV